LYQDSIYPKNNHGIMMDRALISLHLVLLKHPKSALWLEKGISRIREAFHRDFSYKGVHLENSPDYHSMVMKMFVKIEEFLSKNNLTLGNDIVKRIELTKEYMKYIVKPDNTVPLIGDTSLSRVSIQKNF